jgi:membrane protease subunit (stomatin/prohibitin family)
MIRERSSNPEPRPPGGVLLLRRPRDFGQFSVAIRSATMPAEVPVTLGQFISKQFIDVIQWNEAEDGVLSWRYPMQDMEIQNGGQLTVRETQMAAFINEGRIADVFGPGLHTLNTRNLPVLTDLLNWTKEFESPFKSDVYFFSTRLQIDQKWGTATPVTIRDKEFGAVRVRAYGNYAYRIADPRIFFTQVCGTRQRYLASDLEDQLRAMIVERMAGAFANSDISFLDMAANQSALARTISAAMQPGFAELGLEINQFVVESVSLPDELQKVLDQRIGMGMAGDVGRLTQFETAESLEEAARNPGGTAGMGVGLGAGLAMAQSMLNQSPLQARSVAIPTAPVASSAKFCTECGKPVPAGAKFCPECGKQQ